MEEQERERFEDLHAFLDKCAEVRVLLRDPPYPGLRSDPKSKIYDDAFSQLVVEFYSLEGNAAGGNLHIVLDDGNLRKSDVWMCLDHAHDNRDSAAVALCELLLSLDPEDMRWLLRGNDER